MKSILTRVLPLLAALGLGGSAFGQSLYTIDTMPAVPTVTEITGPPGAPGCPVGPVLASFLAGPGTCPAALAPTPVPLGDVTVDPIADVVFATDGFVIGVYTPAGVQVDAFVSPLPALTGLGWDSGGGMLWMTDGFTYGAIFPPTFPCSGALLPFAAGPFPVPIVPGLFAAPINDIDFDGATGSLIGCDGTGVVASFLPAPVPAPGPFPTFFAPFAPLFGICFDHALPGSGIVYMTDGFGVFYGAPGGVPAPPTFYTPAPFYPLPVPFSGGLAYAGRQLPYGVGGDTSGLLPPVIGATSQSWAGNPAYTMTLSGSVPGAPGFLYSSGTPFCPPFMGPITMGLPLYLSPPLMASPLIFNTAVGTASFTVAIPPAIPPGTSVYLQWWVATGGGGLQCSSGAELSITFP